MLAFLEGRAVGGMRKKLGARLWTQTFGKVWRDRVLEIVVMALAQSTPYSVDSALPGTCSEEGSDSFCPSASHLAFSDGSSREHALRHSSCILFGKCSNCGFGWKLSSGISLAMHVKSKHHASSCWTASVNKVGPLPEQG